MSAAVRIGDWLVGDALGATLSRPHEHYSADVDVDADGNLDVCIEQGSGYVREVCRVTIPREVLRALGYERQSKEGQP